MQNMKTKMRIGISKRVVLIMTIYMAISLITYYFGLEQLCKCVLLSLVMTDLLLFKNHKEYI